MDLVVYWKGLYGQLPGCQREKTVDEYGPEIEDFVNKMKKHKVEIGQVTDEVLKHIGVSEYGVRLRIIAASGVHKTNITEKKLAESKKRKRRDPSPAPRPSPLSTSHPPTQDYYAHSQMGPFSWTTGPVYVQMPTDQYYMFSSPFMDMNQLQYSPFLQQIQVHNPGDYAQSQATYLVNQAFALAPELLPSSSYLPGAPFLPAQSSFVGLPSYGGAPGAGPSSLSPPNSPPPASPASYPTPHVPATPHIPPTERPPSTLAYVPVILPPSSPSYGTFLESLSSDSFVDSFLVDTQSAHCDTPLPPSPDP